MHLYTATMICVLIFFIDAVIECKLIFSYSQISWYYYNVNLCQITTELSNRSPSYVLFMICLFNTRKVTKTIRT